MKSKFRVVDTPPHGNAYRSKYREVLDALEVLPDGKSIELGAEEIDEFGSTQALRVGLSSAARTRGFKVTIHKGDGVVYISRIWVKHGKA